VTLKIDTNAFDIRRPRTEPELPLTARRTEADMKRPATLAGAQRSGRRTTAI
jgi:hypothetical protein